QQKLDGNPSGILIYHPAGQKAMTMSQLTREFGFEVLEAFLLAVLVASASLRGMGSRVGFALVVGLVAAVSTNLSYWNWYGFPGNYTEAAMFVEVLKYLVAGIVVALVFGKGTPKTARAAA